MSDHSVKQAFVSAQSTLNPNQSVEKTALFNEDGTPFTGRNLALAAIVTGTAIGTAAKTTSSAEPAANTLVPITFTSGNSAEQPTVAFAGGTPRVIKLGGTASTAAKCTLAAGGVALFYFDGTVLHQIGVYS